MEKLLDKYLKKFNTSFPYYLIMGIGEEKIIEILKESIKNNEPYEPKINRQWLY
mgnify:CR=1 FL=1